MAISLDIPPSTNVLTIISSCAIREAIAAAGRAQDNDAVGLMPFTTNEI